MKRRTLVIIASLVLLGLAAVPIVAFVIVPQFVRSTLVEELPARPGSSFCPPMSASRSGTGGWSKWE